MADSNAISFLQESIRGLRDELKEMRSEKSVTNTVITGIGEKLAVVISKMDEITQYMKTCETNSEAHDRRITKLENKWWLLAIIGGAVSFVFWKFIDGLPAWVALWRGH